MADRPRVYLEEDCPVAELSVEARRERGSASALPPLYFLHVWWARRPLTTSRAAILGSLLPAGFPREDFLALMGIPRGADPVAERERIDEANRTGVKLKQGFSYKRAFSNPIRPADLEAMRKSLSEVWGTETPTVLDSFAGGGSIPFEASRLGLNVVLNELNPVACVIERATIEYPALFGPELAEDIKKWGNRIADEVENQLADCFPKQQGENIFAYIWVRTVECPECSLIVPLSPNWWLDKKGRLGYRMAVPERGDGDEVTFAIANAGGGFDPDDGTVTRGVGVCPRCDARLESDYIKAEAQAGRMGQQLAVVGYKQEKRKGRFFREVTKADLQGAARADALLAERLPEWERRGLVPTEEYPEIANDSRPRLYGMEQWYKFFSPRQLLVHLTTLEAMLAQPWEQIADAKRREAVRVSCALALDICVDYNCIRSIYNPGRLSVSHSFGNHDFSFKWSYAEFDGSSALFRWSTFQQWDAIRKISSLSYRGNKTIQNELVYYNEDATNLEVIEAESIDSVIIDPPYYDNVQYAELADFFYVWMKRSLGDLFPELFHDELTEKDSEAVANVARFRDAGRGKGRKLAEADYEAKMMAAFTECHRVLRDDGVLTIMFTHKRVEAWDTLAMGLLESGFEITATWPIRTESPLAMTQAKKNAAASTILLVCRKRTAEGGEWWEDLQEELDETVRERAEHFDAQGLRAQDTSIACFGPALSVISSHWPVRRKDGSTIRPGEALDRARQVVTEWFFERIAEGETKAVDAVTRFYVLAWYVFGARVFRFDEARKLGLAVGADMDADLISKRIMEKKGDNVRLLSPEERSRKGGLSADKESYASDLDYVQAAINAYDAGKSVELTRFHQRTGALQREGYLNAVGYLLDVLPRTDEVTEYHTLDAMWQANFRDRVRRHESSRPVRVEEGRQTSLLGDFE